MPNSVKWREERCTKYQVTEARSCCVIWVAMQGPVSPTLSACEQCTNDVPNVRRGEGRGERVRGVVIAPRATSALANQTLLGYVVYFSLVSSSNTTFMESFGCKSVTVYTITPFCLTGAQILMSINHCTRGGVRGIEGWSPEC